MKILIIGGTRFFGKRFVQLMLNQGHSVTLLTRGKSTDDFGNQVSRLVADRTNADEFKAVIKSVYDVVVDNMLMNAQEASDAISILNGHIGHYVMTSTLSVYDQKPGALLESDFKATALYTGEGYQQGKRNAEYALSLAPFAVSIMRIPLIVGPDDYTHRLLTHVRAVKENTKVYFPNPEAKFSYLHAQDAARALAWLSTDKPTGTFNVSAPDAWTFRELMSQIEQIVGKKFTFGDVKDTPSPFGVSEDFFANVDKARLAGFKVDELEKWMPSLLEELWRQI